MLVAAFPDWVREDFFHADGNDIFVMGTVEDGDLPVGGDFFVNAPQEIVVQFLSSVFFEGYYVQPCLLYTSGLDRSGGCSRDRKKLFGGRWTESG